eukprot:9484175-Pyramimonas_sp.AAC.1
MTDFWPSRLAALNTLTQVGIVIKSNLKLLPNVLQYHYHCRVLCCYCSSTLTNAAGRWLQSFIREFFDQNPLSQLGLIVARNGIAERITGRFLRWCHSNRVTGSPSTE